MSSVYDYLSYTMLIKTRKLKELRVKLRESSRTLASLYFLTTLSSIFVIMNIPVYLKNIMPALNFYDENTENINVLHKSILILLVISIGCIFYKTDSYKRIKGQYDNLRLDIIKTMGSNFCAHSEPCSCRDEYVKELNRFDIDMVLTVSLISNKTRKAGP